ncbi:MAG: hypothetical protein ACWGN1_03905 [Desulfobulbales bacterium]
MLDIASESGIGLEYDESNSSWYRDQKQACSVLENLLTRGVLTLLISISPFCNEFIPLYRVKGILEACREVGMDIFPWL